MGGFYLLGGLPQGWGPSQFGDAPDSTIDPSIQTQSQDLGSANISDAPTNLLTLPSRSLNANPLGTSQMMQRAGLLTSIFGGVNKAIGAYYSAQSQQYSYKSQALNYQYQSSLAQMNSRAADFDAESVLEANKSQIANYTTQAGAAVAGAKTAMAGRGLVLGQGSTQEVEASMNLQKDVNVLTMNSNAVRQSEALRTEATNYRNQSMLDNVSAVNARRSADSISPFGNMFTSLLGSASQIGMQWLRGQNMQLTGGWN